MNVRNRDDKEASECICEKWKVMSWWLHSRTKRKKNKIKETRVMNVRKRVWSRDKLKYMWKMNKFRVSDYIQGQNVEIKKKKIWTLGIYYVH